MVEQIERRCAEVVPKADFWSFRYVEERAQGLHVRQDVLQPVWSSSDAGVMITVINKGGMGYGATCDLTVGGLRKAVREAMAWAERTSGRCVFDVERLPRPDSTGEHHTPVRKPWSSMSLKDKAGLLLGESKRLKVSDQIVDWSCGLQYTEVETLFLTSRGGRVRQQSVYLIPFMSASAGRGSECQHRSFGRNAYGWKGGLEILDEAGFRDVAPRIGSEAVQLLLAQNCPSGKMDLLVAPDQMALQIHESIGHPLELDRILGDERNYAGTSFVTPEMFGTYRYGSSLLNVVFDPAEPHQLASYAFDDEGLSARREYLIKEGLLLRPLGGAISQVRSGLPGVANARASSWNRPPIDRMANINLEPGSSTFNEMVSGVQKGLYVETNCSWSIDDSRNKFQFGCEWGRLIEDGRLTTVVKNPNYRGISATFWRNLRKVGNRDTYRVLGTPNCGKGEPNQMIRVGHGSPSCLFSDVDVFGGV